MKFFIHIMTKKQNILILKATDHKFDIKFVISMKNRVKDIPILLILMNFKFDSFFMQK